MEQIEQEKNYSNQNYLESVEKLSRAGISFEIKQKGIKLSIASIGKVSHDYFPATERWLSKDSQQKGHGIDSLIADIQKRATEKLIAYLESEVSCSE